MKLNRYPVVIATSMIHTKKAIIIFFLKIELSSETSGILAPAPPIISAIIVPEPTPLPIKMLAMGIIVSVRIYIGIPTRAARGTAQKLFAPAN